MIALRLVLDTNIVVSAALKPDGVQRTVVSIAATKPAHLYISQVIFSEYREVLARPELKIRRALREQFLGLLWRRSRLVKPSRRLEITKDPGDNIFLECAEAARADYLVTGNTRHFPTYWRGTKVITSREFIELVTPHLHSGR